MALCVHSEICVEYSVHYSLEGRLLLVLKELSAAQSWAVDVCDERVIRIEASCRTLYETAR